MLEYDEKIQIPHVKVVSASAGSGKTYILTQRYVQYLLSDKVPNNSLPNILAITFSNNAAREMKERIISRLKLAAQGDNDILNELSGLLSLDTETIKSTADFQLENIFNSYSDFQVKTIDSFISSVFRSSAIDLGYNPSLEISLDNNALMEHAYDIFLRQVRDNSTEAQTINNLLDLLEKTEKSEAKFKWDPASYLLNNIKLLYLQLSQLSSHPTDTDLSHQMPELTNKVKSCFEKINRLIEDSGLERRNAAWYNALEKDLPHNSLVNALGRKIDVPPIKQGSSRSKSSKEHFNHYISLIREEQDKIGKLIEEYAVCYARSFYHPYIRFLRIFNPLIEEAKKEEGKIFINDVGKSLAEYMNVNIVPDLYLMLGEVIYHYLIDEFQDTSPIQWQLLKPLIENSLATGGTLFVVGDTKQAIYTFRGADYKIMKSMEMQSEFPVTPSEPIRLDTNYRSAENVLKLTERTFDSILASDEYREAGERTGLSFHKQQILPRLKGKGYSEIELFEKENGELPEKTKITETIKELKNRGYSYGDIAVLTVKNTDAMEISSWLNGENIPFISHSSLDARKRKITGELISMLTFLSSPVNDLAFAHFCLGEILKIKLKQNGIDFHNIFFKHREETKGIPLYKLFREEFPDIWNKYFENLYNRTGYLPLYDLTTEIYKTFSVYENFPDEEASLTKLLEVIKNFEDRGNNNILDFLEYAERENEESEWNIDTPEGTDAITVMTIHKAKGLGFPVVLVLFYPWQFRGEGYYINYEGENFSLMALNKNIANSAPSLEAIYNDHRTAKTADYLNSLYVALTRAKHELYLIAVKGKRGNNLIDLLPADEFKPTKKPEVHKVKNEEKKILATLHQTIIHQETDGERAIIQMHKQKRGTIIHEILAAIKYIDGTNDKTIDELDIKAEEDILNTVKSFLSNKNLQPYFFHRDGRRVYTEMDVVDGYGQLFRADRVIIDPETVTIIDFKSGKQSESIERIAEHTGQIKKYMETLNEIYPGMKIQGILAYVDENKIENVK